MKEIPVGRVQADRRARMDPSSKHGSPATAATGGTGEAPKISAFLRSPYVSLVSRLILGGVFLYAGASKVLEPGALAASVRSYELGLPEWFVTFSAHALPLAEVLLGLYLMVGLFPRASAWAANVLLLVFVAAILQGALRGLQIDCGCFGAGSGDPGNPWSALARDLGLLVLGAQIAFAGAGAFGMDAKIRRGVNAAPRTPDGSDKERTTRR